VLEAGNSLALLAPDDDEHGRLLLAGGELTWRAGPLSNGSNLCHGTAGNGYALLALFERTRDELWLGRARDFAMHSIAQIARARGEFGRGRYTCGPATPERRSTPPTASRAAAPFRCRNSKDAPRALDQVPLKRHSRTLAHLGVMSCG
jgi:hypothetical protein